MKYLPTTAVVNYGCDTTLFSEVCDGIQYLFNDDKTTVCSEF